MNVACGECQSVFRVDPSKVPPGGVRARCSVCGAVIRVGMEGAAPHAVAPHALATILEQAEGRGLATGIVTTTRITHATPASRAMRPASR